MNNSAMQYTIKVTVLIENSLWTAIFERNDPEGYAVARKIFGTEPSDPELYEFVLNNFHELKFTSPQEFKLIIKRKNYKRMQREVKKELSKSKNDAPIVSHAQETLRIELEKNKKIKQTISKAEKELKLKQKFLEKQNKKKEKQKGH